MTPGNLPKLGMSFNGITMATDSGSATAQAYLDYKAIADMAQKLAGIQQFAKQAGACFSKIREHVSSLFEKAGEISYIGDTFLKQAGETLTQNGEATGAEIGDVTEDDSTQASDCGANATEDCAGNNASAGINASAGNGGKVQTGAGATSTPVAPMATPGTESSEQAGAYFGRRQAALAKETQEDNRVKAEKGDENAQAKVNEQAKGNEQTGVEQEQTGVEQEQTGVKQEQTKEKSAKKDDINDQIEKLQKENQAEHEKREQFKPLVEQDAGQFAEIKKRSKTLDDQMKNNNQGFNDVKKDAKEKMEKSDTKCNQQAALSSSATASATAAQGQNTAAAPLFSNPYTASAAVTEATSAFATNQAASALDQRANQAGQEAAQNFQTAVANMKQGLSQYATPQSGLANQKMKPAEDLLTLNNARKEQIQSANDSNTTIAQNNAKIKKLFGMQTTINNTTVIA